MRSARRDPPGPGGGLSAGGRSAADGLHGRHLRPRSAGAVRRQEHPRQLRLARHDRPVRPRPPAGRSHCGSTPASATATARRPTPAASSRSTASGTSRSSTACGGPIAQAKRHRAAHAHRLGDRPGTSGPGCGAMEQAASQVGRTVPRSAPAAACRFPTARVSRTSTWRLISPSGTPRGKRLEGRFGHPVRLEIEPGRYLVAESGYLVAEIRAIKRQGDNMFYLLDAGFNNLARPILYGAYHPMSIVPADGGTQPPASTTWSWAGRCASRATSSRRRKGGIVCHAAASRGRGG